MRVESGEYGDSEPSLESGGLIDQTGDLWLITDADPDTLTDPVELSTLDKQPGRVRYHHDEPYADGIGWKDHGFDSFRDARLLYGLRQTVGEYFDPEGSAIPRAVAIEGKEAIAAYLRVRYEYSRSGIADEMDVSKQTISNHWNRMRWKPDEDTEIAVFEDEEQ